MEEPPSPGVPNYVSELVAYLSRRPELQGWVPDGTLLALWLMALMNRGISGGGGGIILDVDVRASRRPGGAVGRAARQAATLCESVFGLQTKLLHLNAQSTASSISLKGEQACVVTGLEHVASPVAIKLRREVQRADSLLVWVRDEDYDGFAPWLLDLFACSIRMATLPPPAAPPPGLGVHPLLDPSYVADIRSLLIPTHMHPPLEIYVSNLVSALALHPTLVAQLSRSATASLDAFVRAHTVLSSIFYLPPGWRESMAKWKKEAGLSATPLTVGQGGMGDWASKAGERPKPALVFGPDTQVEDWYARPENARAVFAVVMRHRCSERRGGENMLYALEGSAEDRVKHCKLPRTGELDENDRRAAHKRREDVEEDLVDILEEV